METILKHRTKLTVVGVQPGETFKLIQKDQCLMVIDLTQIDMFKQPKDEANIVLRDDVVYCVDTETGIVQIVPKFTEVHKVIVKVEEV